MRFLQRPKEHQDEIPENEETAPPRKERRQREQEAEVSAYFSARKPMPSANDQRNDKRLEQQKPEVSAERESDVQKARRVGRQPPVDMPEKAFLGFGSRGAPLQHSQKHAGSHGYYSWSQSEPQHSTPPRRQLLSALPLEAGELSAKRRRGDAGSDHQETQHGQWLETRRVNAPARIEIYQPPQAKSPDERRPRPSTVDYTSQSLPKYPETTTNDTRHDRGLEHHTSDILAVRGLNEHVANQASMPRNDSRYYTRKANIQPRPFSPTSKLLAGAEEALKHRIYQRAAYENDPGVSFNDLIGEPIRRSERNDELPYLFQPELHTQMRRPSSRLRDPGSLPQRSLHTRGTDAQRTKPHTRAVQFHDVRHVPLWRPPSKIDCSPANYLEEDEMLDDVAEIAPLRSDYEAVEVSQQRNAGTDYATASEPLSGLYQAQMDPKVYHSQAHDSTGVDMTPSIHGRSIACEFPSERFRDTEVDEGDALDGFWKPHMLY